MIYSALDGNVFNAIVSIVVMAKGSQFIMNKPNRLTLAEAMEKLAEILEAAKSQGPQIIEDGDDVFTVTYSRKSVKPDARDFLAGGGPDQGDL